VTDRQQRHLGHAISVVLVALFVLGWQHLDNHNAIFLSRPSTIAKALKVWFQTASLRNDIPVTLEEAAVGFLLCMAVAIVLAVLLASSELWAAITAPYLAFWNAVPKIALAPLFILIFGIGLKSKVYFIAIGLFIVPFFSLYKALTTVDPVIIGHARMIGASRWNLTRDVYLPAIVGSLAAVLRVTIQFCILGAVFSELIASSSGLGFEIETATQVDQSAYLFAGVLIVSVIGFLLDLIVRRVAHLFLNWQVTS
jgi:NitT/TauT family transport system permease protein